MANRLDNLTLEFLRRRGELDERLDQLAAARPMGNLLFLPPRGPSLVAERALDELFQVEIRFWGKEAVESYRLVRRDPTAEERRDLAFLSDFFRVPRLGHRLPGSIALPGPTGKTLRSAYVLSSDRWGNARRTIENSLAVEDAVQGYPWPGPRNFYGEAWLSIVEQELGPEVVARMVEGGREITKNGFRTFMTLSFIRYFDLILGQVRHLVRRRVRHKRRVAVIRAVILILVSIALGVILSGVALTLARVVLNELDEKQKRQLAHNLAAIAKQFQADHPDFAAEVRRVADELDPEAARIGAESETESRELEPEPGEEAAPELPPSPAPRPGEAPEKPRPAGVTAEAAVLTGPPRRLGILDRAIDFLRSLFGGSRRAG